MTNLEALQTWLLRQLESELRSTHPEAATTFDAAPPDSDDELRAWASQLPSAPVEPWSRLINAVLAVQLSIDQVGVPLRSLRETRYGKDAWFFAAVPYVPITSCLEGLDYLVKRMERGGLVTRSLTEELLPGLEGLRKNPLLEEMRTAFAHGPQQRMDTNWFRAAREQRLWEMAALNSEDGEGMAKAFYQYALERRDARYEQIADLVQVTSTVVESVAGRLLDAARGSATARRS